VALDADCVADDALSAALVVAVAELADALDALPAAAVSEAAAATFDASACSAYVSRLSVSVSLVMPARWVQVLSVISVGSSC
jgi:hypothetical protein